KLLDLKVPTLSSELTKLMANITTVETLPLPDISRSLRSNPAREAYTRLGQYVKDFESRLDQEHEIGARLVAFGQAVTFHIQSMGYWGPDIITFYGVNDNKEPVQLIQHVSQLNVLLVAMKKLDKTPRRIGYLWEDNDKPVNSK